ncbi:MAG: hypothetical protein J6W23_06260 [Victivallales bacterium]|nr:hypothetical protein [Victivallales bacterium]MBO7532807.1 hypothetical protein [Victivallales bacterium]
MEDKLPTPEELGERLKKGEITEAEAIEIMSERARREAFANLFNPNAKLGEEEKKPQEHPKKQWKQAVVLVIVVIILIIIACLLH